MEITFHISWKTNTTLRSLCLEQPNGNLVPGQGNLVCQYGCTDKVAPLHFNCTRACIQDNWALDVYKLEYPFVPNTTGGTITVGTSGMGGENWNVSTTFSLARRSDTNEINSTPRTFVDPVINVQEGYNRTIVLPVSDPDGDIVRCRWAVGRECGSICNEFPGATIDPTTCTITYQANRGLGYKAVAVMLEDFLPDSQQPLSSVALQFLVLVIKSTTSCPVLTSGVKKLLHAD